MINNVKVSCKYFIEILRVDNFPLNKKNQSTIQFWKCVPIQDAGSRVQKGNCFGFVLERDTNIKVCNEILTLQFSFICSLRHSISYASVLYRNIVPIVYLCCSLYLYLLNGRTLIPFSPSFIWKIKKYSPKTCCVHRCSSVI